MSPIKQGAFGTPEEPKETTTEEAPAAKKAAPKRKRRPKAELIEAARIPADDEVVEVKFEATGTKGQRPWVEAVELFRAGKVTFVDKGEEVSLKYSVEKLDQQAAGGAEKPAPKESSPAPSGLNLPTDEKTGSFLAPAGAELGDEVYVGTDRYFVGHGDILISNAPAVEGGDDGMQIVPAQRVWKIEPGTGGKEWRSEPLNQQRPKPKPAAKQPAIQTERVGDEIVQLPNGSWKVGTGILEKIGLPDYSSLQIGPNTMSSTVADDGRRQEVQLPDGKGGFRTAIVAVAAVEAYELCADTTEYVSRLQRGHLIAFLEASRPGVTSAPMQASAPVTGSYPS